MTKEVAFVKRKAIFRSAAISLLIIGTVLFSTGFVDKYQGIVKKLSMLESVLDEYYVGEVDHYKLQEGIYKGYISGVGDAYTTYYTQKEYNDFKEETSGVYTGIGISMSVEPKDNSIVVKAVFNESPAQKAGIKPNDKIIKVAGKSVAGNDYSYVRELIGSAKEKSVDVCVYRPEDNKTYEFELKVENIVYPSVDYRLLEQDIAYIKLSKFEDLSHDQFKEALMQSEEDGADGIILDLRNNRGGLLRIAKDIVDELIPEGVIVSTKDKNGKSIEYKADDKYIDTPMVVLINGNSASASEVVAGALKDYKRAKLVGEKSFGKGVVQTIIPLTDGSAIKLTTSQYFTPSGVCIQGIGIEPDVKVSLPAEKLMRMADLEDTEDDQLQAAIREIRKEIVHKAR